nr:zinc finger protein ZIC 2-like [Nicotiana tomentosiformis]
MEGYVIALIACGCVAAVVLVLYCGGRKKKSYPVTGGAPPPPPLQEKRDVEKGEIITPKKNTAAFASSALYPYTGAPVDASIRCGCGGWGMFGGGGNSSSWGGGSGGGCGGGGGGGC